MIETKLFRHNYYDGYQGWDLNLLLARLKDCLPESEIPIQLRSKDQANWLVLGSATPRNIGHVSRINQYLRPGKAQQDTVTLIDINEHPLLQHQEDFDGLYLPETLPGSRFPTPHWQFAQADMLDLPFVPNAFDVIISDYTINYVTSESQMFEVFAQIGQGLCPEAGLAMVTVRCSNSISHRTHDVYQNQALTTKTLQGGVEIATFPQYLYYEAIAQAGLTIVAESDISLDLLLVLQKPSNATSDTM